MYIICIYNSHFQKKYNIFLKINAKKLDTHYFFNIYLPILKANEAFLYLIFKIKNALTWYERKLTQL